MKKRSAWECRDLTYLSDPFYVADMPSNEERLRHLDYYLRQKDTAPIVSGGKKGMQGVKRYEDEIVWIEEHEVVIENLIFPPEGIKRIE
jgi:hypothetical protein